MQDFQIKQIVVCVEATPQEKFNKENFAFISQKTQILKQS